MYFRELDWWRMLDPRNFGHVCFRLPESALSDDVNLGCLLRLQTSAHTLFIPVRVSCKDTERLIQSTTESMQ